MASTNTEPPLIVVTNPVTYIRLWWNKVMGKEGIDFKFKVHPITAFLIAFGLGTGLFGAGRYSVNIPFLNYLPEAIMTPKPTTEPVWKVTAFSGKLQYSVSNQKFFLLTTSSEAITLEVPAIIDLLPLVGKRIMAVGDYNKSSKLLRVTDATNLEILTKTKEPIPTIEATFSPSPSPIATDSVKSTDVIELNNE